MSLTKAKLLEMGYESGTELAAEYKLNPRTVSDVLARAKVHRIKSYGMDGRAEMVFYDGRAAGIALTEYVDVKQARAAYVNYKSMIHGESTMLDQLIPVQKDLPLPTDDVKSLADRIAELEKQVSRLQALHPAIMEHLHD
jgi:hypothetical protein